MTAVHIVDYDCVTCFGIGHEHLWRSLLDKQCGFKPVTRFATGNYVNHKAAFVSELNELPLGERFPALLDMLCRREIEVDPDAILLTATTKDNIELLECSIRQNEGSRLDFPGYSMLDVLRRRWGLDTQGQNINTACTSGSTAILWASEMILQDQADMAVVCGADLVSEFVFSGFSALKAMSSDTSRPFDRDRDGLILGEAAAFIVLMSEQKIVRENRKSLGVITGWGMSSDAHHITAPDRNGAGLKRAIRQALKKSSITAQHISSINAHGTGTIYNDAMEMTAFRDIFKNKIPHFYSIKGAIGHSLGPSGLIETIITAKTLQEQLIPPVTGLQSPEPDMALCLPVQARTVEGEYALSVNSGFGGINTALVLKRV